MLEWELERGERVGLGEGRGGVFDCFVISLFFGGASSIEVFEQSVHSFHITRLFTGLRCCGDRSCLMRRY